MSVLWPANESERLAVLRALLAQPGISARDLDQQIDVLERYARRRALCLDECAGWRGADGALQTACLCVDSPGRMASVYVPQDVSGPGVVDGLLELLGEVVARAGRRGNQFVQALIKPSEVKQAEVFANSGFARLARLIYLEKELAENGLAGRAERTLSWSAYTPARHELFARSLEKTYEGSLDCVALNGVRDIEDILASHRATGEFDPGCWLLGELDSQAVGVILLAYTSERAAYEVVYMGLVPEFRGRGLASALLQKGIEVARDQAAMTLTLAVDEQNEPARRLYARCGFRELTRRDAWIRLLVPC